ncbi:MAG TPA: hypothetical protein VIN08_17950 [Ohtaekwangia sp.]|uniref:hypothetical protein n=1 Tax=Ohtaekwangia sp. TaxID=2066019 RepID=UPI002F94C832
MSGFHLEKWYLDASDDFHQAFIGYAATLKWKWITLHYSGYTFLDKDGKLRKRNSFSKKVFPLQQDNLIHWKAFDCSGTWRRSDSAVEETLLDAGNGKSIQWQCTFPKAGTTVSIGDSHIANGWGYAEKINLTITPWKLPIDELHWGRFLSEDHTVIWIRWIGPVPKTLVYYNGRRITEAIIEHDEINFNQYILRLSHSSKMRTGTITDTVFSRFPALAKLFPKSILQLQENKWLSSGTLHHNNRVMATGKAIHEIVQWK